MQLYDIAIIGGGIWGLSTAFHLARAGHGRRVVVLERNAELAGETTGQSAGQVGQLRGDPLLVQAVGYTLETLAQLALQTGHDPGFVQSGSVHLALNAQRVEQFSQLRGIAQRLGFPAEAIDVSDACRLVPGLKPDQVQGALHVPRDGYVDAPQCARAYGFAARDGGVTLECDSEIHEIGLPDEGPLTLATTHETFQVGRLIVTAGPWTRILARRFGCAAPMYPIRLQQARSTPHRVSATHPVVRVPDESCYVRPELGGYLYGFFDPDPLPIDLDAQPPAFRTPDVKPEPLLIEQAQQRLHKVLPQLSELPIDQYRQGMMTCTPDGRFVLGPVPGRHPIWIATGCGGTGIAASAAIGRWLARWSTEGSPGADLAPYAVDRFGANAQNSEWLRERACATSAAYYRLKPIET